MIPYASFFYFGVLLYLAVPVLLAAVLKVPTRHIVLASTILMVVIQYGGGGGSGRAAGPGLAISRVFLFAMAQWLVAAVFLRLRTCGRNRAVYYSAVALALAPLVLEKLLPGDVRHVVAFVGISYTTFRALDVTFGIEDGLITELPPTIFLSYMFFFPAISAGPIDRYRRFLADYRVVRSREQLLADVDQAIVRIMRGLLYAFVIAPLIDFYWIARVVHQAGGIALVSYMYAYSLHLFFDFAGYSAFAIGVGYVLGVRMPENFNRPFLAQNITEFWTRWHISLSSFLRDHVYGRFVLASVRGRWFRDNRTASYLGSTLAFGLMGLWHGLAARYVFYGLYHALLVVGHGVWTRSGSFTALGRSPTVARILTFHAVCVGFLIFSGRLF